VALAALAGSFATFACLTGCRDFSFSVALWLVFTGAADSELLTAAALFCLSTGLGVRVPRAAVSSFSVLAFNLTRSLRDVAVMFFSPEIKRDKRWEV
jgi:hypothetical protein